MSNQTVPEAIETFLAVAANAPTRQPEGYAFHADRPGRKFTRIIMTINGKSNSVHAFVDNVTGDLLKAAGYAAPAKGARYNLLTNMEEAVANFSWAGGYLYQGWKKVAV